GITCTTRTTGIAAGISSGGTLHNRSTDLNVPILKMRLSALLQGLIQAPQVSRSALTYCEENKEYLHRLMRGENKPAATWLRFRCNRDHRANNPPKALLNRLTPDGNQQSLTVAIWTPRSSSKRLLSRRASTCHSRLMHGNILTPHCEENRIYRPSRTSLQNPWVR